MQPSRVQILAPKPRAAGGGPVLALGDDADLVAALRAGHPAAPTVLFDRHAPRVQRVLVRTLGFDPEIPDLVQEVFVRALQRLDGLRDGASLSGWLSGIAVFTARETIRRRARWRWLRFLPREELPEVEAPQAGPETSEALRSLYAVLEELSADERIAFALRYVEQMELTEVAEACGVSLATLKRRLARAESRFVAIARRHPALEDWIEEGGARWRAR